MIDNESKYIYIKFRVNEEEEKKIKNNAKACGKTVSAYIRECALNMCVIPIDVSIVEQNAEEVASYRNVITQLVYTIKKSGRYTPGDLEYILEKTKELIKISREFSDNYLEHLDIVRSTVEKTVKGIVKERKPKRSSEKTPKQSKK